MTVTANSVLVALNLQQNNHGACAGVNAWLPTQGSTLASINPANAETLANVVTCQERDYQQVITQAQSAYHQWRQVPAPKRGEIIRQIGQRLRELKDPLGSLVSLEMGKSKQEGDGEVQEMIDMADFAVGQSRMLYGKTMHSEREQHRMYEQWHPLGVVGIITAFNFPVAVWAWNAFIAAICGNAVVWKPSPKTPLCAVAVQHICNHVLQQNDCPGIFSLFVPESDQITETFLRDTRVPLMSFTGSCRVGRYVNEVVAKRMGRSLLELGGNNAIIIDETADLSLAIPAVVFGAVGTAGQRCTTTRRVFLHDSIYSTFCEQLVNAYQQINIGDPLDENNLMGPVIDQQSLEQYQNALLRIHAQGGKILFGGEVLAGPGFYVQPTLVTDVHNDWDIVQEETFAPILYLMPFSDLDAVIAQHNQVQQGLSSALFTRDLQRAEQFLSVAGSDCGIANINIGTSGAEIGGAFGGEKDTGGGREAGSDAWKAYMRRQTNTINWGTALPLAQGIRFELA